MILLMKISRRFKERCWMSDEKIDETDREILESFMEDTSDEVLHNGNYSKTSPYSEQDD